MRLLRPVLVAVGVVLLALVWEAVVLPPPRCLLRYGPTGGGGPTGRRKIVEGVEFVEIAPGYYRMGSHGGLDPGGLIGRILALAGIEWDAPLVPGDEGPARWVEIPYTFFLARTEVTNAQFRRFSPLLARNAYSRLDDSPVGDVSFRDATRYCAWLSESSGREVRLPSEAEWEFVCQAGSRGEFCFGDDESLLSEYAWHGGNSEGAAHAVGTRRPNAWGLSDLHGNVREWCGDVYRRTYGGTEGPGDSFRAVRGGGFSHRYTGCRSRRRSYADEGYSLPDLGFRLVTR